MSYQNELRVKYADSIAKGFFMPVLEEACSEVDRLRAELDASEKLCAAMREALNHAKHNLERAEETFEEYGYYVPAASMQIAKEDAGKALALTSPSLSAKTLVGTDELAALREATNELIKLRGLMTNDDGVDPEAWWIELSSDDKARIDQLIGALEQLPGSGGSMSSKTGGNLSADLFCKCGTLQGYCPEHQHGDKTEPKWYTLGELRTAASSLRGREGAVMVRDCWNCHASTTHDNNCTHCGARNPWGQQPDEPDTQFADRENRTKPQP